MGKRKTDDDSSSERDAHLRKLARDFEKQTAREEKAKKLKLDKGVGAVPRNFATQNLSLDERVEVALPGYAMRSALRSSRKDNRVVPVDESTPRMEVKPTLKQPGSSVDISRAALDDAVVATGDPSMDTSREAIANAVGTAVVPSTFAHTVEFSKNSDPIMHPSTHDTEMALQAFMAEDPQAFAASEGVQLPPDNTGSVVLVETHPLSPLEASQFASQSLDKDAAQIDDDDHGDATQQAVHANIPPHASVGDSASCASSKSVLLPTDKDGSAVSAKTHELSSLGASQPASQAYDIDDLFADMKEFDDELGDVDDEQVRPPPGEILDTGASSSIYGSLFARKCITHIVLRVQCCDLGSDYTAAHV